MSSEDSSFTTGSSTSYSAATPGERRCACVLDCHLKEDASAYCQVADLTGRAVGSVLNGGGSWPEFNKHAAVNDWINLADGIWAASPVVMVPDRRGATQVRIPAFWGIDAVHGNSNV